MDNKIITGDPVLENLEEKESVISSVDLMKRTGLSRATLNNYIKKGLLPHPVVKRPGEAEHLRAKRMGYFPDSVLGILNKIIQFKNTGHSMEQIQNILLQKSGGSPGRSPITGRWTTPVGERSNSRTIESETLFSLKDNRTEGKPPDRHEQGSLEKNEEKYNNIEDLIKKPSPIPLSFSILAVDIQDSIRICAELPPEEYFRFTNEIWICANGTFKNYYGTYGKHSGNGIVYYFLKSRDSNYLVSAIFCALELREKMKNMSDKWKKETGWCRDLYMNIGINEGYEFFGRVPSLPAGEIITLGETANIAITLSQFSRSGSIWATKNLLNRLDEKERKKIRYGIQRSQPNHHRLIENTFSRIGDLIPKSSDNYSITNDFSPLIVTEICNLR